MLCFVLSLTTALLVCSTFLHEACLLLTKLIEVQLLSRVVFCKFEEVLSMCKIVLYWNLWIAALVLLSCTSCLLTKCIFSSIFLCSSCCCCRHGVSEKSATHSTHFSCGCCVIASSSLGWRSRCKYPVYCGPRIHSENGDSILFLYNTCYVTCARSPNAPRWIEWSGSGVWLYSLLAGILDSKSPLRSCGGGWYYDLM